MRSRRVAPSVKRLAASIAAVAVAVACAPPAAPTPPPGGPPTIVCPLPQNLPSPDGNGVVATYFKPSVSGGAEPVDTTCSPDSGSIFGVGTTNVACTATDAQQRATSCSFGVTVVYTPPPPPPTPKINATNFLAFGDSMTYGSTALCNRLGLLPWDLDVQSLWANVVPDSYPSVLQSLLAARYTTQTLSVVNEGVPGERVVLPATASRLTSTLNQHAPQVLLLQEGVNDLHRGVAPAAVVSALRGLVRTAQGRGVRTFVGTLLPEVRTPSSCRAFHPELIVPTNTLIRSMVASEGAELVDLYAGFGGEGSPFIGPDGLHPSTSGYSQMAQTFYEALRARLEAPE
jgi:lysophospholipase L1-like esterase